MTMCICYLYVTDLLSHACELKLRFDRQEEAEVVEDWLESLDAPEGFGSLVVVGVCMVKYMLICVCLCIHICLHIR